MRLGCRGQESGKDGAMGMVEGKIAIITGATSGIGARTAEPAIDEAALVTA